MFQTRAVLAYVVLAFQHITLVSFQIKISLNTHLQTLSQR